MDTVRIAGREFKAVTDSTLAHDIWVIERLKCCGLENAVKSDDEPEMNLCSGFTNFGT